MTSLELKVRGVRVVRGGNSSFWVPLGQIAPQKIYRLAIKMVR